MKSDLILYIVAVACFILAALTISGILFEATEIMIYTLTVAFAALGVIFLGVGYASRPKEEKPTLPIEETKPMPPEPETTEKPAFQAAEETTLESAPEPPATEPVTEAAAEEAMTAPPAVAEAQAPAEEPEGLTKVKGIGPKRLEQLKRLGIYTVYDLADADAEDLAKKTELSPKITRRWVEEAKKLVQASA